MGVAEAHGLEQAFSLSPLRLPFAQVASAPICACFLVWGHLSQPTCGVWRDYTASVSTRVIPERLLASLPVAHMGLCKFVLGTTG